jgi:cytochrome c-type biogenesis protein CcmH
MIWLAIITLTILALSPLAWVMGAQARVRGRQDTALTWHRAQLAELDRNLAEGQLLPVEHGQAVLEVQRRLLAADNEPDRVPRQQGRGLLKLALVLVPLAALGLYLIGGMPGLPAAPLAGRDLKAEAVVQDYQRMAAKLKAQIATYDPQSDEARRGYVLLGGLEARAGDMQAAVADLSHALALRFDPVLAIETAEAMTLAAGHDTPDAAALLRRALDTAPPNAPWRAMVEKRLQENHDR